MFALSRKLTIGVALVGVTGGSAYAYTSAQHHQTRTRQLSQAPAFSLRGTHAVSEQLSAPTQEELAKRGVTAGQLRRAARVKTDTYFVSAAGGQTCLFDQALNGDSVASCIPSGLAKKGVIIGSRAPSGKSSDLVAVLPGGYTTVTYNGQTVSLAGDVFAASDITTEVVARGAGVPEITVVPAPGAHPRPPAP